MASKVVPLCCELLLYRIFEVLSTAGCELQKGWHGCELLLYRIFEVLSTAHYFCRMIV